MKLENNYDLLSKNKGIWMHFESNKLKALYLSKLCYEQQKNIARFLNSNLNQGLSTIQKYLIKLKSSNKTCELPLNFVFELCSFLDYKGKHKIYYLTYKNHNTQPVKLPNNLSPDLAFILGAHIADGHMSKNEGIVISEGHLFPLQNLKNKFFKVFGILGRITREENYWKLWVRNKVIAKYFQTYFGIPIGPKSKTIKVPTLIRKSNKVIKKAFLRGIFTFDGCVKTTGIISLTSQSKSVIQFASGSFEQDGIKHKLYYNKNKLAWLLESSSGRNNLKVALSYFERHTLKYKRLVFFIKLQKTSLKDLKTLFPKHYLCKTSLLEVYNAIKKCKRSDATKIKNYLGNVASTTLYKYFYILFKAGLIQKDKELVTTSKNGCYKVYYSTSS